MSIIKEKDVRMGAVRVIGCQSVKGSERPPVVVRTDYKPVVPRVISSRSAIIKAGTFRMDNPRVINADIRPVVVNMVKPVTVKSEAVRPALTIPPRQPAEQLLPRFTRMRLEPIKQAELKPEQVKQQVAVAKEVVAPLVRVEPAPAVTDAVFVPEQAVPKIEGVINADARTTLVEEFSVKKLTFNPRGLWARARGFIKGLGLGIDQGLEYVAKNLYRSEVYVIERVRILPG